MLNILPLKPWNPPEGWLFAGGMLLKGLLAGWLGPVDAEKLNDDGAELA